MMTARVITTILRLHRPIHPCIVVMTLAVIWGGHHAVGRSSCGGAVIMRWAVIMAIEHVESSRASMPPKESPSLEVSNRRGGPRNA